MSLSSLRTYHIFSLKQAKRLIICLVFIFIFDFFFFSIPVLAYSDNGQAGNPNNTILMLDNSNGGDSLNSVINKDQSPKIEYLSIDIVTEDIQNSLPDNPAKIVNNLPDSTDKPVLDHGWHRITAYNSEVSQCDDSPCITANGFNVCQHKAEDTIATNFLPFGAKIMIPDLFGDRIFTVRDRMSQKHPDSIDIWMNGHQAAMNFGVKLAKINVINEP
jgi:3D (Asp-Asp-Asp) domain-containing protein